MFYLGNALPDDGCGLPLDGQLRSISRLAVIGPFADRIRGLNDGELRSIALPASVEELRVALLWLAGEMPSADVAARAGSAR